jgi:hypothetical protein
LESIIAKWHGKNGRSALQPGIHSCFSFHLLHRVQLNIYHFVEFAVPDATIEFAEPPNTGFLSGVVERQQMPP